ncbi:MAG: hypothetical protein KKG09_01600 [Verrucomicrobia bacterium]|nr:hypothetical protein [Verrucomicrobiota bacterium]MBU4247698.1 hypothetical protein [Verrucomicrobiota bacterium]MBU4290360.1 hypothetical protein [Verrucomicrobiota bacterium]MBU4496688.1 hypothetical protein [Verrucomicrobiota bacterium]MCG2679862.1 hypothetical protein [Kiritimatiellia bacterium]
MTSREIITRNLTFKDPARIGMSFSFAESVMDDICGAGLGPSATWTPRRWTEGEFEYYDDEWGNIWYRVQGRSAGGEIHEPALRDWAMLKDLRVPDFAEPSRYRAAAETFAKDPDRYHLASLPGFPFAICRYLRKMEIYFQDLILEREHVDALHDQVTGLLEAVIRQYGRTGADGIFFCEDWGTQERLLVSPAMWREIFKPLYRRLGRAARESGLHVLMHSCGYNWEILDDLAEVGVNCVQFDQPSLYGLERLAEKLQQNKVCLFSPVDVQKVLPTGDRKLIESTAAAMARLFSGRHGGFIAKNYPDLVGIGVKPEWNQWAYDSFVRAATG